MGNNKERDPAEVQQEILSRAREIMLEMGSDMLLPKLPSDHQRVNYPDGSVATLKIANSLYRYYEGSDQRLYAYTPWANDDGWYLSWVYMPVGPGSRSGKAKQWEARKIVRFRKRKLANERAHQRYKKAERSLKSFPPAWMLGFDAESEKPA